MDNQSDQALNLDDLIKKLQKKVETAKQFRQRIPPGKKFRSDRQRLNREIRLAEKQLRDLGES